MLSNEITWEVRIQRGELTQFTQSTTQAVAAAGALAVQRRAQQIISGAGRVRTGRLMSSITVRQESRSAAETVYLVGSDLPYARFQHDGIGPVVPRRAKVLRFKPKGSSSYVFAMRTRGFEGIHYLQRAVNGLSTDDFVP